MDKRARYRIVGTTPGEGWILVTAWRDSDDGQVHMERSRVVNFLIKEEIDLDGSAYEDTIPQVVNEYNEVGETEGVTIALIHPSEDNSWVTQELAENVVLSRERSREMASRAREAQEKRG